MSEHGHPAIVGQYASIAPPRIICRFDEMHLSTGQCDCACAKTVNPAHLTLTPFDHTAPYMSNQSLPTYNLSPIHQATLSPRGVVVLNQPAAQLLTAFHIGGIPQKMLAYLPMEWPREPTWNTLQEMVSLGLLSPLDTQPQIHPETPTTLPVWLHVTNACNLRCAYCYRESTPVEMSPQVGRQAVEAVFRSALAHGLLAVKLKYAGGEPTLRFPLVLELHRQAIDLAEQHGLELDGVVLSNGVGIGPQMIETMQSLGLRLAISLDGLGPYHDCQRHFADGRGSFEAVARTIDRALSAGLVPDISITISGRNADGLPELMTWVLERDLPFSLNFYRENNQSASQTDLRLEEECIIKGMLAAYKVIEEKMPERCLLASLADRANLATPHLRTCSVGHSYLVIDHRGRVAKCQMDMANTVTTIHDPDPLTRVRESSNGIRNLPVDDKAECHDCQWRYWCAGGCPLTTYRATGCYDVKSPNCNIYRALYSEVIRLEGLRLLKYADKP